MGVAAAVGLARPGAALRLGTQRPAAAMAVHRVQIAAPSLLAAPLKRAAAPALPLRARAPRTISVASAGTRFAPPEPQGRAAPAAAAAALGFPPPLRFDGLPSPLRLLLLLAHPFPPPVLPRQASSGART